MEAKLAGKIAELLEKHIRKLYKYINIKRNYEPSPAAPLTISGADTAALAIAAGSITEATSLGKESTPYLSENRRNDAGNNLSNFPYNLPKKSGLSEKVKQFLRYLKNRIQYQDNRPQYIDSAPIAYDKEESGLETLLQPA